MNSKVLLITNKEDVTIDFIVKELQKRKVEYYRLNTEDIPNNIKTIFNFANNKFFLQDEIKNRLIDLLQFDAVYFRRPKVNPLTYLDNVTPSELVFLQKELSSLLEGIYKILENKFWLNNVYKIREAENKILQLTLAQDVGFTIPPSLISNDYKTIESFFSTNKNDCIFKPIKNGAIHSTTGAKVVFTSRLDHTALLQRDRLESFPLYFQKHIRKTTDLRCTVIGNCVYAVEIHSQNSPDSKVDWRKADTLLEHKEHLLPASIANKCVELTKQMGLNYSAIDLIFDDNKEYLFLELNPNGQWAWIEKRLGYPLSKAIVDILTTQGKTEWSA